MKNLKPKSALPGKLRFIAASIFALVLLFASPNAIAQDARWGLELRPAVNVAVNDLGGAELKPGYGFDAAISYRFMPHLGIFGGWGWNKFPAEEKSFAGENAEFEETGYALGLQFIHPLGETNANFMIRGAGIYNHIEVENPDGDIISDSGHGFGFRVEGGMALPLSENWRLLPSLRYQSLARELELGEIKRDVNLNYLSLGIGVSIVF